MKRFVIYYENPQGVECEWWTYAPNSYAAKTAINQANALGDLDEPMTRILSVNEVE